MDTETEDQKQRKRQTEKNDTERETGHRFTQPHKRKGDRDRELKRN